MTELRNGAGTGLEREAPVTVEVHVRPGDAAARAAGRGARRAVRGLLSEGAVAEVAL